MKIGFLAFPHVTLLDLTGPYEVLSRVPGGETHIVTENGAAVVTDTGFELAATTSFDACPALDLLVVPGGPGQSDQMDNAALLELLEKQARGAQWITSVCTGSLLLGAAGLLQGYRATCHWSCLDQLAWFGATPVGDRLVIDRDRATGGGVTAGIDFALGLVARVWGETLARSIMLGIEYRPAPPFRGGHPDDESPEVVAMLDGLLASRQDRRRAASRSASERLFRRGLAEAPEP